MICRALHTSIAVDNTNVIGIGTSEKYYSTAGGLYYDVTPIRLTTSAGDVTFTASTDSSTITVTDTDHGANINDYVTCSGATAFHASGNLTADVINQESHIASVTASNNYT